MGTFKLSLPTDIPWRRICVSQDMLDPTTCDDERPPRWRSSLAAFRYDPAEEYQPHQDEVVSYIKIVATLAPYQPEVDLGEFYEFMSPQLVHELLESQFIVDQLEESFPCYGAILQVSVGPTVHDLGQFPKDRYPYIVDCEPKKRELYEMVTETGEVLMGSSTSLTVGKAATNTRSTEDYDLEMGGGGGASIFWGVVEAQGQEQEQKGTVIKKNNQVQVLRSTENTTERRELQSHTTQLTQMYNLFQVFHLGTNRALFLMEPRPHIRQTEATFINGPRALEGVQEVFLVVVRPKAMHDFCVNALLETAHLSKQPILEFERKDRTEFIRVGPGHFEEFYYPDEGYSFDTRGGAHPWEEKVYTSDVSTGSISGAASGEYVKVDFHVGEGGYRADLVLHMISKERKLQDYARKMFLSARELCCCPPLHFPLKPDWITAISDFGELRLPILEGRGGPRPFVENRRIAARIRQEMIRSFRSSRRQPRGKLQYIDSDVFHMRVADLLRSSAAGERLRLSVANVEGISDEVRGRLYRARGANVTVEDVVTAESDVLARILDVDLTEVGRLKKRLLREISRRTP